MAARQLSGIFATDHSLPDFNMPVFPVGCSTMQRLPGGWRRVKKNGRTPLAQTTMRGARPAKRELQGL
jgi:hypothetical protein